MLLKCADKIKNSRIYFFKELATIMCGLPIAVVGWSKAWTLFACWTAGIVGSNRTQGMDVCVHLFCVLCYSVCR
jgi:hypothetical protein